MLHKTDNVCLNYADINNGSSVEANTYNKPDIDGQGLNSYFLRKKTVTLNGLMKANTKEELEYMMNTMLGKIAEPNQTLQVLNAGIYYRAVAHCTNLGQVFKREHYHNTFVPFSVVFEVLSPFWESATVNSITYNVSTVLQEELVNTGSAKASPIITISFISASATNSITMVFGTYTLVISSTIVATDIFRINSETKEVMKNGVAIDYSGQIPILSLGSNPFTITINGTFNADIGINYREKFI